MSAQTPFAARLNQLRAHISAKEAWLLTNAADIFYLTGFRSLVPEEREAFLVLTVDSMLLIHASFSPPPPSTEQLTVKTGISPAALVDHLRSAQQSEHWHTLRADLTSLMAHEYQAVQAGGWQPLTVDRDLLWQQRIVKDDSEQATLRKAGKSAAQVFQQLRSEIKSGQTEIQIAHRLEVLLLEHGSDRPAFPTIVAFGGNGALPHHQPTNQVLEENTPILIDFGATVGGYRSDMTRSWWFGSSPSEIFVKIEKIVRDSYQAAANAASQPDATVAQIDIAARTVIKNAGYASHFIHTTGHGVGIEIHEPPSVYHTQSRLVEVGMAITIEPGIYIPDQFGYRYENTILIGRQSIEELTQDSDVQ